MNPKSCCTIKAFVQIMTKFIVTIHHDLITQILNFISSLWKQVVKPSNKSMMVNFLIMNCSLSNEAKVEYNPAAHRESNTHALQHCILERHLFSRRLKIVFNAKVATHKKNEARLLVFVEVCLKELPRRSRNKHVFVEHTIQQTLQITRTQSCKNSWFRDEAGTIVERSLEDVQYQICMREQGYTQSDTQ